MKNWCLLVDAHPDISCELKVFNSVEDFPAEVNSFLSHQNQFFFKTEFLKALQGASGSENPLVFVVALQEDVVVALGVAHRIRFNGTNFKIKTDPADGKLTSWMKRHIGKHSDKLQFDVLVLGIPSVSGEYAALFSPELSQQERSGILVLMMESLQGSMDEEANVLLVKDFYTGISRDTVDLSPFKYRMLNSEPNLVLEIDPSWHSFDDYTAAMTKKYRQRGKNVKKKSSDVIVKEFSAADVVLHETRMHELYMNIAGNASFRLFTVPSGYFSKLKNGLKDKMGVYGYFLGEELIGFRSSFRAGDGFECHYVGFDPVQNRAYDLYQNMLFDYIEEALKAGAKRVLFGRTAGEMKSNYGAKPIPQHAFVRYNNSVSNKLIKPFVRLIKPEEWVVRNPFKE